MGLMTGKKGIIFGVSNTHGIAYAIAQRLFEEGADIPIELWDEKIGDSINYLLLLTALIHEHKGD